MSNFKINTEYFFTFTGSSEKKHPVKVMKKTEKTLTLRIGTEPKITKKIFEKDGYQYVYPLGRYTNNPILKSTNQLG